jgi:GT2 family glycosyltransferase
MKISIVIPTKGRGTTITQALQSAANQTVSVYEVLIIDGSSERMPADLLDQAFAGCKHSPVLVYLHKPEDKGLPEARNRGVRASSGDIVQFLDDDAVMAPDYFEHLLPAFHSADVGAVSGLIIEPGRSKSFLKKTFFSLFYIGPFRQKREEHLMSKIKTQHATNTLPGVAAYRREVFDQNEFDENLKGAAVGEDVEFSFRVGRKWRMLVEPSAKVYHYPSPAARLDLRSVYSQKIRFYHYHYCKNIGQGLVATACYYWLNLGFLIHALTTAKIKAVLGVCDGIGYIFKSSFRARHFFAASPLGSNQSNLSNEPAGN